MGFGLFFIFYDQAFPSASLKLELSKEEIAALAESELRDLGFDPGEYHSVLTFGRDSSSSVYLQRMLGIPATNRLVVEENLPFYYWRMRWFQPLELEEFRIYLSPSGELLGFSHKISESEPGASLDAATAESMAQDFLMAQGWTLEAIEQVRASSEEQPEGRMDHYFTWERQDFEAAEATLRLSVSIYGDEIGHYNYWMKTPEEFWRDFSEQQNHAGFIDNLATMIGDTAFWIAALVALALSLLWGIRSWKQALFPAILVGGIVLLSGLNDLSLYPAGYNTTQAYPQFWFGVMIDIFGNAAFVAIAVGLLWLGGTSLARWVWPAQDRVLERGPDRWILLSCSAWRGLMMGGIALGYAIIFYWVATQILGGWTPMQTGYSNGLATPFPFLGPLEIGIWAAFNEELLYRLVGIGLIFWLFRKRWLALLIPGALWAFAHLTYVRDPFYMRGIELTIAAVFIYGLFFWKFGLLTTIVGHITFNALLGAIVLFRSPEPKFVLSGMVVVIALLLPVLPGLFQIIRRKLSGISSISRPEICPAVNVDIAALKELPCETVDWQALFSSNRNQTMMLVSGENILGAAWGGIDDHGNGTISGVYVDPGWRRQYWGTRLAEALGDQLREIGAQRMDVSISTQQKAESSFWASQGWRPIQQVLSPRPWPPKLPSLQQIRELREKAK